MLSLREGATTLADFDRWWTLAWFDTSLRYRRTVLGPWWVTLSTGIMIGSVGLVFGSIFGTDLSSYIPFFAIGNILWTMISGAVIQGCNVFVMSGALIKSMQPPMMMLHVLRMMATQLIVLAHNAVLIGLIWLIFRWRMDWSSLLVLPGLALLIVALCGTALALGIVCVRFRDIQQMAAAMLQLLFLLTPIIWMPSSLRGKATSALVDYNPLYYLIEVVRGPLLGSPPGLGVWLGALAAAIASMLLGLTIYGRFRHRIAYWL